MSETEFTEIAPPPPPPDHLIPAILMTIFCCLPFGIGAIVLAARANQQASQGNLDLAYATARRAKRWIWVGVLFGILFGLLALAITAGIAWLSSPEPIAIPWAA